MTSCCHIFTHDDLPIYWFYKQAFHINRHFRWTCFHTVKPKLVTQPAVVQDFFLTHRLFSYSSRRSRLASSWITTILLLLLFYSTSTEWRKYRIKVHTAYYKQEQYKLNTAIIFKKILLKVYENWLEFVQPGNIRLAGEILISTILFTNVPAIKLFWVTNKLIKYTRRFPVGESFWNILVNKDLLYSFKRVFAPVMVS